MTTRPLFRYFANGVLVYTTSKTSIDSREQESTERARVLVVVPQQGKRVDPGSGSTFLPPLATVVTRRLFPWSPQTNTAVQSIKA